MPSASNLSSSPSKSRGMSGSTQTNFLVTLSSAWLALPIISIFPVYLYLSLFRHCLIDDAFINLQYALNLRDYGNWGFYPDVTTNTATSPLNLMLTAFAGLFVSDMVEASIRLATAEFALLFALLLLISRKVFNGYYFGVVSFLAILANPLLMSTLGLESLLYTLLLTACIYFFLLRKWHALAVLLALLTLTRPDGVLLFAVMFCFCTPGSSKDEGSLPSISEVAKSLLVPLTKQRIIFCSVYVLCLLPWYLFSWVYLGSLVPDTLFIKISQSWPGLKFSTGILSYMRAYPLETAFSFFMVPFAGLCVTTKNRQIISAAVVLFLFSLTYFIGYSVLGTPPYHWYFVPVAIPYVLMGALGLSSLYYSVRSRSSSVVKIPFYVLPSLSMLGIFLFFTQAGSLFPSEVPIHTNWATHDQYKEVGLWIKDNVDASGKIRLGGEIGTVAFYSQRRLMEVISCRDNKEFVLQRPSIRGAFFSSLRRVNFFWFKPNEPCGPYSYQLTMYPHPVKDEEIEGTVIKRWDISTKWIPEGSIVLHQ